MSNTILRQVVSGDEAKQQLLNGLNKVVKNIVGHGLSGKNVLLKRLEDCKHNRRRFDV
jgi:hypothetical protein